MEGFVIVIDLSADVLTVRVLVNALSRLTFIAWATQVRRVTCFRVCAFAPTVIGKEVQSGLPARRRTLALIEQVLGLYRAFLAACPAPKKYAWFLSWDSARRLWRILPGRRNFDAPVAFGPLTLGMLPALLLLLVRRTCIPPVVYVEDVLPILSRLVVFGFLVLGALRRSLLEPATVSDRPRLLVRRQE